MTLTVCSLSWSLGLGLGCCRVRGFGVHCLLGVCVYPFFSSFGRIWVEGEYVTYVDKLAMNRSWTRGEDLLIF